MSSRTGEAAFRPELALRLKHLVVGDALWCLEACIGNQAAAQRAFDAARRDLAREQKLAAGSGSDDDVEAFAAWLPDGRKAVHRAGARLEQAIQATAVARAALSLARTAADAQDRLIARRSRPIGCAPQGPDKSGVENC